MQLIELNIYEKALVVLHIFINVYAFSSCTSYQCPSSTLPKCDTRRRNNSNKFLLPEAASVSVVERSRQVSSDRCLLMSSEMWCACHKQRGVSACRKCVTQVRTCKGRDKRKLYTCFDKQIGANLEIAPACSGTTVKHLMKHQLVTALDDLVMRYETTCRHSQVLYWMLT